MDIVNSPTQRRAEGIALHIRLHAVLWAAALVVAGLAFGAAHAANRPDLTGTWVLDASRSDDPVKAQQPPESNGGSGMARRVANSVSVFGIPVGALPLPSKSEPQPLGADDLPGAEQILGTVTRMRILQEESATEFDYGGSWTAAYAHDGHVKDGEQMITVGWHGNDFEIVHQFDDGIKVTETYYLGATGQDLHWAVRLKHKHADEIQFERVFERESGA